jgi:4-hydroxybenzoate polyprenyltransferase
LLQSTDRTRLAESRGLLRAYLELLRPPNVVTAIADVLAGYAVARRGQPESLPWLIAASVCLYAGGVVLNDVFDRHVDAIERPERPIPSRRVTPTRAATIGGGLLLAGTVAAVGASRLSAAIAAAIAAFVLLYDARAKRHPIAGPLCMGVCRGLNLLLGVSAEAGALRTQWPLGLLSVVYIGAVTTVSRGEVHGGRAGIATGALISLGFVLAGLTTVALRSTSGRFAALVLIVALAYRVVPPYWQVRKDPQPAVIRRAVKTGVLSLVLLDSAIAAAYAGPVYAAMVLATGVVAGSLARLFSVT